MRWTVLLAMLLACGGGDRDGDGYTAEQGDCDDAVADIHPAALDLAGDGVDQNCDGVDGIDGDADGYASEVSGGPDCDDTNAEVSPDGVEVCGNGLDDDCDGVELLPTVGYLDADGDGFGDPGTATESCELGSQYVRDATDCDDSAADVYPGGTETCDGRDNDCANGVDDGLGPECACSLKLAAPMTASRPAEPTCADGR